MIVGAESPKIDPLRITIVVRTAARSASTVSAGASDQSHSPARHTFSRSSMVTFGISPAALDLAVHKSPFGKIVLTPAQH